MPAKRPAPAAEPWKPFAFEKADVGALQALARGECEPHQQKRVIDLLVDHLCATYDLEYRPGPDGDRDSAFAAGRRYVGLQIVKALNLNVSQYFKEK